MAEQLPDDPVSDSEPARCQGNCTQSELLEADDSDDYEDLDEEMQALKKLEWLLRKPFCCK
ncbi:MAG TPA: hypothetical protein VKK79_11695 [Candidatus Lokiarchaeia archaeon]|nr:hypothetical protein [Candidatus Lokiarchaeia archaeon]